MTRATLQGRFEGLLEEHKRILYKICNSYCRNHDDREDLAQEIAVQLWRSFGGFDERQRFSTWMYRIALNVAISFYRRERTRTRHVVSGDEQLLEVADERAEVPGQVRNLFAFIETLDPLHRALVLLYLDGYSHRDTAEVLGITESNVATKIGRVKQRMKQQLAGAAERSERSRA